MYMETPAILAKYVEITNHGSILLVRPRLRKVARWFENNVEEDAQWFGNALVVEPRCLEGLVLGVLDAFGEVC